jgi:hypothetical protein
MLLTLVGDSNVKRQLTSLNTQSRASLTDYQLISFTKMTELSSALQGVREESNICIVAVLTEALIESPDTGSLLSTVDPVMNEFRDVLRNFASSRTSLAVMVAPPLFRPSPYWYKAGLPQIAKRFSECLSKERPKNLMLLSSFISQDLMPDRVHLTPVSGLHYLLHLVDESESLIRRHGDELSSKVSHVTEVSRQLTDRVSYLELDHSRLVQSFDTKVAEDSEFNDWLRNRNEEDWIVVTGLPRLSASLSRQAWQRAVKEQVGEAIKNVLHANRVDLAFSINLVTNATRGRTTGRTVYNVQLTSVESARRVRELFSGFFRRQNPVRLPAFLVNVSFRNKITFETRVRIAILRQLGENYKSSNEGSSFIVRGYDSRPLLILTPPQGSSERSKTLTFIQAIRVLPVELSDDNLIQIFKIIGSGFRGQLRSLFVILKDELHDYALDLVKKSDLESGSARSGRPGSGVSFSGVVSGAGSGVVNNAAQPSELAPITPEPPRSGPPERETSHRSRRSRSQSRSRSPRSHRRTRSRSRSPLKGKSSRSKKRQRSRSRSRSPARKLVSKHRKKSRRRTPSSSSSSSTSGSSSSRS